MSWYSHFPSNIDRYFCDSIPSNNDSKTVEKVSTPSEQIKDKPKQEKGRSKRKAQTRPKKVAVSKDVSKKKKKKDTSSTVDETNFI